MSLKRKLVNNNNGDKPVTEEVVGSVCTEACDDNLEEHLYEIMSSATAASHSSTSTAQLASVIDGKSATSSAVGTDCGQEVACTVDGSEEMESSSGYCGEYSGDDTATDENRDVMSAFDGDDEDEFTLNDDPLLIRVTKVESPSSFYIQTNDQWNRCNELIRSLHDLMRDQCEQQQVIFCKVLLLSFL